MSGNTFGTIFKLTTFGESHGAAIGGVVDGCPAGLTFSVEAVQAELDRRRPGSTPLGTSRNEGDHVEILSGVMDGVTLGTPIGFIIRNTDAKSKDYDHLKDVYRPGHADLSWDLKYGVRDHRGGGRSSARETACRVVGGAIARQILALQGVVVQAYVSKVGEVKIEVPQKGLKFENIWQDPVRCPHPATSTRMAALIEQVRTEGDSVGGVVSCRVTNMPVGLGEPVFDKLDADLAKAMLSINACKGFQIGSGYNGAAMRGSENNDAFIQGRHLDPTAMAVPNLLNDHFAVRTSSDNNGGTLGGISYGDDLLFDAAFKPPSTIAKAQQTMNTSGEEVTLEATGRHDPCVVPRAVPVVEAMTCLVLADHLLRQRSARIK